MALNKINNNLARNLSFILNNTQYDSSQDISQGITMKGKVQWSSIFYLMITDKSSMVNSRNLYSMKHVRTLTQGMISVGRIAESAIERVTNQFDSCKDADVSNYMRNMDVRFTLISILLSYDTRIHSKHGIDLANFLYYYGYHVDNNIDVTRTDNEIVIKVTAKKQIYVYKYVMIEDNVYVYDMEIRE